MHPRHKLQTNSIPPSKQSDNSNLYYGNLLLKTSGKIEGYLEELKVTLDASTLPGSELFILVPSQNFEHEHEDFIRFGHPDSILNQEDQLLIEKKDENKLGIDLQADLAITNASRLHLLMDPQGGDQLTCRGDAKLHIEMTPQGELIVLGDYIFTEGNYFLNYEDLVTRNFKIREGSSLIFTGDPLNTSINIQADYQTKTSTYELISTQVGLTDEEREQASKPVAVFVNIDLLGDFKEPALNFDISIPTTEEDGIGSALNRKLVDLKQDPNELNKQVFGLLFFNSFIAEGQGDIGEHFTEMAESAAISSFQSLIASQLNRLASDHVKGVEISIDLSSYQANLYENASSDLVTEMEVKVSKQLFKDRMTLEVGGNLNMIRDDLTSFTDTGFSNIAGDFVMEYKLNKKGNTILKVFHLNDFDFIEDETNYKTGASIVFRKALKKKRSRNK